MIIKNFRVRRIFRPLFYPFRTTSGQHDDLENVLFRIELSDGTVGFGEAAVASHITGETVAGTTRNLKKAGSRLVGRDLRGFRKIIEQSREALADNRAAAAAVEMAILDAVCRSRGIPLWRFFGPHPRKITTDITIVISSLAGNRAAAKKFYSQGFRKFKIKIGRDPELDFQRVVAVARIASGAQLYLDANQGYTAEGTIRFLKALRSVGIRPVMIEQPVPKDDWDGLQKITRSRLARVCVDESAQGLADCLRVARLKAADVINIKLMKSGFLEGEKIARYARRHGLKLMIGGMMESNLAMTAAAHFAAGLACFDFIDLDPPFFIKGEAQTNPYLSSRGVYDLKNVVSGIGIETT